MAASWKPEDVPAELIEFACAKEEVGLVVWPHELRAILAVVLPEYEHTVREQVARDHPFDLPADTPTTKEN